MTDVNCPDPEELKNINPCYSVIIRAHTFPLQDGWEIRRWHPDLKLGAMIALVSGLVNGFFSQGHYALANGLHKSPLGDTRAGGGQTERRLSEK